MFVILKNRKNPNKLEEKFEEISKKIQIICKKVLILHVF